MYDFNDLIYVSIGTMVFILLLGWLGFYLVFLKPYTKEDKEEQAEADYDIIQMLKDKKENEKC